jgi:hypothetical protein
MAAMNRLHPLSWIATSIVIAALCLGCQPKPAGGGGLGSPGVVSCGTKAVGDHAVDALPGVNRCLGGDGDVMACLLGLVQPALGIVLETVACVTKHEGAAAHAAAQANPGDTMDLHRANRAREFLGKLADRGYTIQD